MMWETKGPEYVQRYRIYTNSHTSVCLTGNNTNITQHTGISITIYTHKARLDGRWSLYICLVSAKPVEIAQPLLNESVQVQLIWMLQMCCTCISCQCNLVHCSNIASLENSGNVYHSIWSPSASFRQLGCPFALYITYYILLWRGLKSIYNKISFYFHFLPEKNQASISESPYFNRLLHDWFYSPTMVENLRVGSFPVTSL